MPQQKAVPSRGRGQDHKRHAMRTERMCRSCGLRGPVMQDERGNRLLECPRCGADLYTRPPMSYAEMEGLLPDTPRSKQEQQTIAQYAHKADQAPRATEPPNRHKLITFVTVSVCTLCAIGAVVVTGFLLP